MMAGTVLEYKHGQFPDLFLLCSDVEATIKKWDGHTIVRLHYLAPKPHTMLAIIMTEKEISEWQVKANGAQ